MSTHTPGPWRVSQIKQARNVINGPQRVCMAVSEADGHLIAAAPDLLAALKELSAHVEKLKWGQTYAGRPHAIADAAHAAIAKAEGSRP